MRNKEKVSKVIEIYKNTTNGLIVDSDTILVDIINTDDNEISELSVDI